MPAQAGKGQKLSKQQRILRDRDRSARRREALDAAAKERAALEARMAREAVEPAAGPTPGALYVQEHPPTQELPAGDTPKRQGAAPLPGRYPLPAHDAQGHVPRGEARAMLRQGYHIDRVRVATGWGMDAFDDLPLDELGYGLTTEQWIETLELGRLRSAG